MFVPVKCGYTNLIWENKKRKVQVQVRLFKLMQVDTHVIKAGLSLCKLLCCTNMMYCSVQMCTITS